MKLPSMIEVESSNLQAIGHGNDGLFVQFKGGMTYQYPECPKEVFHQGLLHESPGTWFRESVKGKYEHKKL